MAETRFRQLVYAAIALLIGVESFAWFYVPSDVIAADFYFASGYGAIFDGGLVLYLVLCIARLLILVGLLAYDCIARTLFLALTVATILQLAVSGFYVNSPVIAPFDFLSTLIDGAIIAFAYFSSVSTRFEQPTGEAELPSD